MAEPTTQDEGIAALNALDADTIAPEIQEIVDPIVEAAKAPTEREANIEPAVGAPAPHRPVQSASRVPPTRLQLAETGLEEANQRLVAAKQELADAALAATEGAAPRPTLVEMNALAKEQQAPEAAARRKINELIVAAGLDRRPRQTHSAIISPLPNTEASVEE